MRGELLEAEERVNELLDQVEDLSALVKQHRSDAEKKGAEVSRLEEELFEARLELQLALQSLQALREKPGEDEKQADSTEEPSRLPDGISSDDIKKILRRALEGDERENESEQDHDEPDPVKLPTTPAKSRQKADPSTPQDYLGGKNGHWVSENIGSGRFILLEDGSLWKVSIIDKINAMLWLTTESITVLSYNAGQTHHQYKLFNESSDETVVATHLGSEPQHTIKIAARNGTEIILSDGTAWEPSIGDQIRASFWYSGNRIRLIKDGLRYEMVNVSQGDVIGVSLID